MTRSGLGLRRGPRALGLTLVAFAVVATPASAVTVVVGNRDLSGVVLGHTCRAECTFAQSALPEPQTLLATPTDGTITTWLVRGTTGGSGGSLALRVLRPAGGGQFTGAGTSAVAVNFDGATPNTANLPVAAGDQIGLEILEEAAVYARDSVTGASFDLWAGGLADAVTSAPSTDSYPAEAAYDYNATVQLTPPSVSSVNGVTLGSRTVTISGAHLAGATSVAFDGAAAASFTVNSDTQISATAPSGASGIVDVTVTTPAGVSQTSSADQYTLPTPPMSAGPLGPLGPTGPLGPSNALSITGVRVGRAGTLTVTGQNGSAGTDSATATATVRSSFAARTATHNSTARARRVGYGKGATSTSGAGTFTLTIKPTRAVRRVLAERKKLIVSIAVTFTPTGGAPNTRTTTVPVKLRPKQSRKR